jgi:hypothetical protein
MTPIATSISRLVFACLAAVGLATPMSALAAPSASCTVSVDYVYNGTVVEPYVKEFVVESGVTYTDDFSTTTRSKVFTASLGREAGKMVVSIDYFNDVGVFYAIGVNTKLTLHGRALETTSGSHGSYISSGVTPSSVGGNHETNYTLMCTRL